MERPAGLWVPEKGAVCRVLMIGNSFCWLYAEELYGMTRLQEVLGRVADRKPEEILPAVKEDIDAFVGTAPQFDDITMLCLEYKARMVQNPEVEA